MHTLQYTDICAQRTALHRSWRYATSMPAFHPARRAAATTLSSSLDISYLNIPSSRSRRNPALITDILKHPTSLKLSPMYSS
jgi:hypothetical protein